MYVEIYKVDRTKAIRKATREGYIPIIELVGLLAEDTAYIDILPILYKNFLP